MQKKILVIDDDEKLNKLLIDYLSGFSLDVTAADHPETGLRLLKRSEFDLVILDIMLPDMDGFEVCREIRKESSVPVIMLTARGDVTDRIVGLELGADDYLPKPFEPRELVARIQSVLRRGGDNQQGTIITAGNLKVDMERQQVTMGDELLDLTTMEFEVLSFFISRKGKVLTRDSLMEHLRGMEWDAFDRSIDVLVSRLRQKLGDDPKQPHYIRTVWGAGYKFVGGGNEDKI